MCSNRTIVFLFGCSEVVLRARDLLEESIDCGRVDVTVAQSLELIHFVSNRFESAKQWQIIVISV